MQRLFSLTLLLILPSLVSAQSILLPPQVKGDVGGWIHIKPLKVDGGTPKWRLDPELEEIAPETFLPPEAAKVFIGKLVRGPSGKFKIEAWNAKGDVASELATCWVVIGKGTIEPIPPPPTTKPAKALTFVVIGTPEKTAVVTENEEFRDWLKSNGIGIYGVTSKAQQDANPKFAGIPNHSIVLQDSLNNVISHSPITTLPSAKAFVTQHLGGK